MGRQRKPSSKSESDSEEPKATEYSSPKAEAQTPEKVPENPLAGMKAKPRIVEAPAVNLPKKRDLGGKYKLCCKLKIDNGDPSTKHTYRQKGEEIMLTDKEARHYLQFGAVSPLD